MCNNGNLGMVYAGRFIAGVGIGQASVVAPIFPKSLPSLFEVSALQRSRDPYILASCLRTSPAGVRLYTSLIPRQPGGYVHPHFGIDNWYLTNGTKLVPTSLHLIFAILIAMLSFFNYESPRYLIRCGKDKLATENLARVRNLPANHEVIVREILEIQTQLEEEKAATLGQGWKGILREMFLMPSNFYRIYLGFTVQLLTQGCGAQSITVYAPDFLLAGVSQNEKLFATCILGIVKFVGAIICAFSLVDVIGRKRSLGRWHHHPSHLDGVHRDIPQHRWHTKSRVLHRIPEVC
jgi:hypothetical protein